ncbi:FISUMP domain-containing protein [Flexithrix dorotheae]|uniref:FISUMP domain-containing protein n=1 Tax=Flexithrix dorotheae TaxID=70993 RepID=UPI0003626899|nr:FISUMP domain-containing protein [Flexithrix dorotheae]
MKLLILFVLLMASPILKAQDYFEDPRDGNIYELVKVGSHWWFRSNLKYQTKASWCFQNPKDSMCAIGNYYYPEDLPKACPNGWRVPTWAEYTSALHYLMDTLNIPQDSVKFIKQEIISNKIPISSEGVLGITFLHDSIYFNMLSTGWIQGKKRVEQTQTTMWIEEDIQDLPQPHVHIREDGMVKHAHHHNVEGKPKKQRRFSVRCVCDAKEN